MINSFNLGREMFSRAAVRSRSEIKKGLLKRAFERGGEPARVQMEERIERRMQKCRDDNEAALLAFGQKYEIDTFDGYDETSRYLTGKNLTEHMEGGKTFLRTNHQALNDACTEQDTLYCHIPLAFEKAVNVSNLNGHEGQKRFSVQENLPYCSAQVLQFI